MVATRLMTVEEVQAMGSRAERVELIEGELREVPASGFRHGSLAGRLVYYLSAFVLPAGLGEVVTADAGFVLGKNPDTLLAPDVSFVSYGRSPSDRIVRGFAPFAPDIAVEIESPSNTQSELLRKTSLYLSGGARLVWLIRPEQRTVTVFRPDEPEVVLSESDTLDGGDVLPGFALPLRTLFH
ncbi:MAG: Uma2 family endonuclease, partial [Thermomicrobiales bacterium]|nr:Uma2 family endonuclease [Thermomicrobiales bacterium]